MGLLLSRLSRHISGFVRDSPRHESGGAIVIVDNAGDDEFTALGGEKSVADIGAGLKLGFEAAFIDTAFEFETLDDARRLLGFYFGERGRNSVRLCIEFRVACFVDRGVGATP